MSNYFGPMTSSIACDGFDSGKQGLKTLVIGLAESCVIALSPYLTLRAAKSSLL
jgi:hypothetical protein